MDASHSSRVLRRLVTYVPTFWARKAIQTAAPPRPSSEWRNGAVLAFEVTGFAALAEQAGRRGRDGAAELARQLDLGLGAALHEGLLSHDGLLVRLGGTISTAFFLGERGLERAAWAARRMDGLLERQGPRLQGEPVLRLRAGIAQGPMFLAQVGHSVQRMEPLIGGPALHTACEALEEARVGQLIVATGHVEPSMGFSLGSPRGPYSPVEKLAVEPEPVIPAEPALEGDSRAAERVAALRPFVTRELYERIERDPAGPGEPAFLGRGTVMLAEFWSVDPSRTGSRDEFNDRFLEAHRIVERHGGRLERMEFTGRGRRLTATFGVPTPRGSDEERAMGCALELRSALGPARMRASVEAGFLFAGEAGSPLRRDLVVLGEAVQAAARLLESADEGAVVAGSEAWRFGGSAFELGPGWYVRQRGTRAPLQARAVLGRSDRIRHVVPPGRLAGRTTELGRAVGAAERIGKEGGSLVVVADQGMGKTRFLREVVAQSQGRLRAQVRRLRCSYLTREQPFGLVEAMVQAITGEQAPLPAWIEREPELLESQSRLMETLQVPSNLDGLVEVMGHLAADALAVLVQAPRVLLVIDDLHEADPWSLEVVRTLVREKRIGLVASSARELGDSFETMTLPSLDERALVELTREQLGESSHSVVSWLIERSAGRVHNARALLGWLQETDALERSPDGLRVRLSAIESALPMPVGGGNAVDGKGPYPGTPSEESGPNPLPDVALPEGDPRRREMLRRMAEQIESLPGAADSRVEELALLYGESDRPEKAVHYARVASRRAAERRRLGRALKWSEAAARSAQLIDDHALQRTVRLEEAEGWHGLFDPQRAAHIAREVWNAAVDAGDASLAVRAATLCATSLAEGCLAGAEEICRAGLALAEGQGDDRAWARCMVALASVMRRQGNLLEAEVALEEAVELSAKLADTELGLTASVQLGLVAAEQADFVLSRQRLERAVQLTEAPELARHRVLTLLNLGVVRAASSDLPGAEDAYREAEKLAAEMGLVVPRAAALVNLSDLFRETGDLDRARQYADLARLEASRTGDVRIGAASLVARALAATEEEDGLALGSEALGALEPLEDASTFIESAARLSEHALHRGERAWALQLFTAARARADSTGIARHDRLLERLNDALHRSQPLPRVHVYDPSTTRTTDPLP